MLQKYNEVQPYSQLYTQLLDSIYTRNHLDEIKQLRDSHTIEMHDQRLRMEKKSFLLRALLVMSFVILLILLEHGRRQKKLIEYQKELSKIRTEQMQSMVMPENESFEGNVQNKPKSLKIKEQQRKTIELCSKAFSELAASSSLSSNAMYEDEMKKMKASDRNALCMEIQNLMLDLNMDLLRDCRDLSDLDLLYCDFLMLGFSETMMYYCSDWSLHAIACRKSNVKKKVTAEWKKLLFDEFTCSYNIKLVKR